MNNNIYIGKITSTHGIKGEIKIKSSFEYKDKAFRPGNKILINNTVYTIKTYRRHKDFEMITLVGFDNINDVLFLMKNKVFIDKNELKLSDEVLDDELLLYKVICNNEEATIKEIFLASPTNKIIRILLNDKEILVPYNKEFVKVDKNSKMVYINLVDGMIL